MPARAVKPASMQVYDGMVALGRIVEIGRHRVEAYRYGPAGEDFLGTFTSRQEAMKAVSAPAEKA
jgi:hypothetical protein